MSGKAVRETLAALGVIASMVFVGWEIRQNNRFAEAAAYQAIGIATADFYHAIAMDDRLSVLWDESNGGAPNALAAWTQADWAKYRSTMWSTVRMTETVQLQVERGVLQADAMERLGYEDVNEYLETWPAFACVWPSIRDNVGEALRSVVEEVPVANRYDCDHLDLWYGDIP